MAAGKHKMRFNPVIADLNHAINLVLKKVV